MKTKPGGEALPRATLLEMYSFLRLTRALEDRTQALFRQNKVSGGLYSSRGQEAISIGSAFALEKGDYLAPMIRNLGAVLVRGHTPREVLTQYMGRATSPTGGKDNTQHFGDVERTGVVSYISMLGAGIPVMSGLALGAKLKGQRRVALTYIGDGGSSTGDFYEGMNFAAVLRLPLVVIIENNQYAYSTPTSKQSLLVNLSDKAKAFGIPGATGDGNDVVEVYRMTKKAVEEARAGGGPQLLEFKTFRMRGHAAHDDAWYVPRELFEEWKKKDPIDRCEKALKPTAAEKRKIEARIEEAINDALEYAEGSPMPEGSAARKGVFEDDSITDVTPWGERDP